LNTLRLGICTIQRDRGRWLPEWVAFHHAAGFRKFYIFLHRCTDHSEEVVRQLQKHFDIQCFVLGADVERPQLAAYQHAYQIFGHEVDWMAFIDGDEFVFSPQTGDLRDVMAQFQYAKVSALGAWWVCYGSAGHVQEPDGLIIENYQRRPELSHLNTRHFKCIVRGHQGETVSVGMNAHSFNSRYGTVDERLRPLSVGYMPHMEPSYELIRINHYVCQSLEYFETFKQNSGMADAGATAVRPKAIWDRDNINDVHDPSALRYVDAVKQFITAF
jgi:hypothetical protein